MNNDEVMKALINILTPEQKANLIKSLSEGDQNIEPKEKTRRQKKEEETVSSKSHVFVNEDFRVIKNENASNRKTPVKFKENRWVDEGEFKDIHTPEGKRTPRNRQPQEKITLECHVCGKEFKQNSSLVYGEFHRCNRCTGR
jgi:hypothetical protein